VLRRDGSSLGFGAVDLSSNQAVTGTLPVNQGGTGITSFGAGVATWLGTPTSANLAAAVTDETGTGALVFGTNPVIDGATIPARTNPLAQAVSVQMTASATVGGIRQLDNDNLDMGTNDFTLEFDEVIPTTRPASDIVLDAKSTTAALDVFGFQLNILSTGFLRLLLNGTAYTSTVALASATNVNPKLSVVVVRETESAAGSVTFYSNGVILGTAVTIAAHGALGDIVSNGTFDDATDWTVGTNWSITGGVAQASSAGTGLLTQDAADLLIPVIAGRLYKLTVTVSGRTTGGLRFAIGEVATATVGRLINANGTSVSYILAGSDNGDISIRNGSCDGAIDDLSIEIQTSISNTQPRIINGTTTTRTAGSLQASRLFNRALTSAEVLDLSINGVALADRGASQTPVYESDFSAGVDGWAAYNSGVLSAVAGNLQITSAGLFSSGARRANSFAVGARYRITGTVKAITTSPAANMSISVANYTEGASSATNLLTILSTGLIIDGQEVSFSEEFVALATSLNILRGGNTSGQVFEVLELLVERIGLTSELIASNAQSDTGQIFDTSGNKNHALLPASGATVVGRPVSQTREVRWTNTWAGTNELQYIGGVNQAILPANAYIESIVGTVSGATPHDIIIGNGSDTDRYVTITTGLAAGTTNFALAARTTDGTNLKLTVDPDTNATMSIAWVISYKTLES
jgi:predicted RecA/RadA family phage recombinase